MIEMQGNVEKVRQLILDNGIINDLSRVGFEVVNSCHDKVRLKWSNCLDDEKNLQDAANILGGLLVGIDYYFRIAEFLISTDRIKSLTTPNCHARAEAIRPNELLYDKNGLAVAIKTKGKLLAIIEGEE